MKIAIISPSATSLENLGNLLTQANPARNVTRHEGGVGLLRNLASSESPDVFVIEGLCHDVSEFAPIEQLTMQYPHIFVIMLCARQSPELLVAAMRAGIREILPSPVTQEALEAAVLRAETKAGLKNPAGKAQIVAFISSKGGSGATFLAANIGHQLSLEGKKVLLIDLNLQFGEAVLMLNERKAKSNIAQLALNLSRLDASLLNASLVQITPTYFVLAAPDDLAQAQEVRPAHVDAILNIASSQYDFIFLDVRRTLDDLTIKALDRADKVFLVVQTLLPYIRNANRLLSVFRSLGYGQQKIEILVNRYWRNDEIGLDELRTTLGIDRLRTIPNGYKDVAKAINLGVPLASVTTSSSVYRAISAVTQSLLPATGTEKGGEMQGSLLSRLLRH